MSTLPDERRCRMIARTPEEAFQAGWDDGAGDKLLTREETTRMAALHGPYLRDREAA